MDATGTSHEAPQHSYPGDWGRRGAPTQDCQAPELMAVQHQQNSCPPSGRSPRRSPQQKSPVPVAAAAGSGAHSPAESSRMRQGCWVRTPGLPASRTAGGSLGASGERRGRVEGAPWRVGGGSVPTAPLPLSHLPLPPSAQPPVMHSGTERPTRAAAGSPAAGTPTQRETAVVPLLREWGHALYTMQRIPKATSQGQGCGRGAHSQTPSLTGRYAARRQILTPCNL